MQISDRLAQDAELVAVAFAIYHGLVLDVGGHEGDGVAIAVNLAAYAAAAYISFAIL